MGKKTKQKKERKDEDIPIGGSMSNSPVVGQEVIKKRKKES